MPNVSAKSTTLCNDARSYDHKEVCLQLSAFGEDLCHQHVKLLHLAAFCAQVSIFVHCSQGGVLGPHAPCCM